MLDFYDEIARYYDSENVGLVEDLSAYDLLVERFGGPVLDVGTGTGRVALHLAAQDIRILGVDPSSSMLERARANAEKRGEQAAGVEWMPGDIRDLALAERFGLAIFAFSGFMHLLEHGEQIKALRQIAAHLRPGGGVVIDLANPIDIFRADDVDTLVVERMFIDAETGQTVIQQSLAAFDRISQIMSLTWVYDRIGADGLVHRTLLPQRVRYTLALEMRLLLQLAGFDQIEVYGDYAFEAYTEDSPRLFVVATKAASSEQ